jgi:anti-anti-sigma regulatory factor
VNAEWRFTGSSFTSLSPVSRNHKLSFFEQITAMEFESHILGEQVVVQRYSGALDDSQAEMFSSSLGEALKCKEKIIVDLVSVRPLSARILVLLLGVTKRAKGRGGGCWVIPPSWVMDSSQGPKLNLTRYGFSLVESVRQGLDAMGLREVADTLPDRAELTQTAEIEEPDGTDGSGDDDNGSLVGELTSALDYWFAKDDEGDAELNDKELQDVAGGAGGGILSELKHGFKYWVGRKKDED